MLLAAALMIPALFTRPMVHDSFWIDFVWADQFTAELRKGVFYPRWLPQSHEGLGSPVFYFYPPLGFYLTAVFGLLGATTYGSILLAFATALAGSGVAMFHWLKGWTARPLEGACFYMFAPYHLCDFYYRGALAESCAFIFVPLVALGLRRCAERRGYILLALSYCGLILCHLPLALLTSLFLIGPYCLWLARERRDASWWLPAAAGLMLGLGLSAIYLVPALTLQHATAAGKLWALPVFQPSSWNFFTPASWPAPERMPPFIALTGAVALVSLALLLVEKKRMWAVYSLGLCLFISGLVPLFWSLPLVEKVQFPWRLLTLAEFGLATAIALSGSRLMLLVILTTPLLFVTGVVLTPNMAARGPSLKYLALLHPDVLEYMPPGATDSLDWGKTLQAVERQRAQPPVRVAGGVTVVRLFYFPAWQADCRGRAVTTFPDPATKLLAYRGHDCALRRQILMVERAGLAISLLATFLLFALMIRRRWKQTIFTIRRGTG
jgi:uncharacterized membrane protein